MSNYAIIETGSKQYRVEPKSVLEVELLKVPEGQKEVSLDRVLFVNTGKDVKVGNPVVKGASVLCDFVEHFRAPKVVSMKFRKRKSSKTVRGHRQELTRLVVKEIRTK